VKESEPRTERAVKHELFDRLRRDGVRWSRNRNFELYQTPAALRTLHRVLWLRQLERDLTLAVESRVRLGQLDGEGYRLELELPSLRLRRSVHLTSRELAALREGPASARLPPDPEPPSVEKVECCGEE